MKSITAVLFARVLDASTRRSAKGREYLSIKAEPVEAKAAEKIGAIWITSFHKSHMAAGLKPGMQIRAEGPLDVQRYERDGEQLITLWLTADNLTLMLEIGESPLSGARAAGKKAAAQGEPGMTPLTMPVDSSVLVPGIGSVTTACPSDAATEAPCETQTHARPATAAEAGRASDGATRTATQTGCATSVFDPRSKPKLSETELFGLQFPKEMDGAKKYARPFDDRIDDLF